MRVRIDVGADGEGLDFGDAQSQERGELVAWAH